MFVKISCIFINTMQFISKYDFELRPTILIYVNIVKYKNVFVKLK